MSLKANHHIIQLPKTAAPSKDIDPVVIAQAWITSLESILGGTSEVYLRLSEIFHEESWWRDMLALQWDLRTLKDISKIEAFLRAHQPNAQLSGFRLQDEGKYKPTLESPTADLHWVSSMFFFDTKVGKGAGILRLTQDPKSEAWKAYSVYTSLQELKEHWEPLGHKRAYGTIESMPGGFDKGTWLERRQKKVNFEEEEPQVLVVGAGQAGLNLGARLQSLGLSTLIVDKNNRVGDNWRNRYRTLVTHDPAEFTHMAYLPFPKNWPQFTPKDKLGDWFEAYASLMELNVWTRSKVEGATYDDAKSVWTVNIRRYNEDGTSRERIVKPSHIVWATGHAGEPQIPTFPGQDSYQGVVYHGSQHQDASKYDVKGKKVVVVGTGNSGHDIAENFYQNGAEVTMVQRSGTYVLTLDKGVFMLHEGCHDENTQLIIDGKIKVRQSPEGIKGFTPKALILANGSELEADVVVLATDYGNMRTTVRKALGDGVADKLKDVWDLDEEGELNAMWRPSGHPRFWYMGGGLALVRIYSKFLALQIKAVEEGYNTDQIGKTNGVVNGVNGH
ncbi:hypothetical protein ZTR_09400 [Talaromyces verruculosus]|nr:hypothetical protein ZTR_09400 [Talaromyces verruculosus]